MTASQEPGSALRRLLEIGDEHRRGGDVDAARSSYEEATRLTEVPAGVACLRMAQLAQQVGDTTTAQRWAVSVVDAEDDFATWQAAAALLAGDGGEGLEMPPVRRRVRLAVLGSSTTSYFTPLLRLAARRLGVVAEVHEAGFGQYEQQILDPASALYSFAPDVVVLAVDESAVRLPARSSEPDAALDAEVRRWTQLWQMLVDRTGTRIVHHNAVVPVDDPLGNLSASMHGSRRRLLQALNHRLAESAPDDVTVLDVDRLAARVGKSSWLDPRYWHLYRLPAALGALPTLARHTAAVMGAQLGLSRKCLAVDLDNTMWGGVLGEDGLQGIRLGTGPSGSPYRALQSYLLELKERGVILAVCSKNDEDLARTPFEQHPEMLVTLDDIAVFIANWESKSRNLRSLAATLDIGLDAIAFLDDNPFERQEVRRMLPEVDVISLPADPAHYVRALSDYTGFETTVLTAEDSARTAQYRARAQAKEVRESAASLDDYYRDLQMSMLVRPFEDVDVPRIAQLIGKTNQFNLTTRRHSVEAVQAFKADADCVDLSFRVRDRFVDHGLVGVMVAHRRGDSLDIDTWLMSCRVIGRGVESAMIEQLERRAADMGCVSVSGTYIPTAKNGLVADLFERLGFEPRQQQPDGATVWRRAVSDAPRRSHHLHVLTDREDYHAAA